MKTKIYEMISKRPLTASQLASRLNTTEGTVRARVSDLRSAGFPVSTTFTKSGKTAYTLA